MKRRTKRLIGRKFLICFGAATFLLMIFVYSPHLRIIKRDAIYLARPLWDKPGLRPQIVIPHFYASNLTVQHLCRLHHWTPRKSSEIPAVIDTVIFSAETDLLEIRLKELWSVVDKFVVVESNLTFSGKPKPLYFNLERERFKWAEEKLYYFTYFGLETPLPKGQSPFYNEMRMRLHMKSIINSERPIGIKNGDILIESDVDEIPSARTIRLLKSCQGYPDGLHLEMRNYLYSFEFYMDRENWKPHISIVQQNKFSYRHHWSSNYVLADAGWHCSFCFRYLSQFIFKMLAYSHTDRVTDEKQLLKENIQDKICRGADIFDMFPEGYTYKELISKMGDIPKTASTIDIPEYIVQNSDKFAFLLPGGCIREDFGVEADN